MRRTLLPVVALAFAALLPASAARADIKPHPLISDGMVLQRGVACPLWGSASTEEEIRWTLTQDGGNDLKGQVKADQSGAWTIKLPVLNYSEMAALIAPRPFMVERGHFDGVGPDERVALEFAKVRHLYQAKLGLGDRAAIEWFVGPHTINGKGTFDFLHKHLKWPRPEEKK